MNLCYSHELDSSTSNNYANVSLQHPERFPRHNELESESADCEAERLRGHRWGVWRTAPDQHGHAGRDLRNGHGRSGERSGGPGFRAGESVPWVRRRLKLMPDDLYEPFVTFTSFLLTVPVIWCISEFSARGSVSTGCGHCPKTTRQTGKRWIYYENSIKPSSANAKS